MVPRSAWDLGVLGDGCGCCEGTEIAEPISVARVGFERYLRSWEKVVETVEYVHHNPVRRGLVDRSTEWVWSSARWYAGEGGLEMDRV